MRFLDRIVGKPEYRATLQYPDRALIDAFGGTQTFSGQQVNLEKALGLTAFRSAVQLISETIGLLPLKVYRENEEGEKSEARSHRAWRMLHDRPNPATSAHRFWSTVAVHLLIWNNVYLEKLRGPSGLVEELWPRDPRNIRVEFDDGLKQKRFYEDSERGRKSWTDETMLHIVGWSVNGLVGESTLFRGRQTIGNAIAREEFEGSFFRRGATLASVIEHPGRLGDNAAKRLRDYFSDRYGGSRNAFKTPVLEEGAKIHPVAPNLVDLDFERAQARTRTEVAIMFNLPPSFLGGTTGDSLTYATVESNMIQFVQHAVAPHTSTIAKALASDPGLFPFQSWYPEFTIEGLLKADSKARADFYKIMHEIGALELNEIRAMENRPPLEDEPEKPSVLPELQPDEEQDTEEITV
jgi:HK97 family phage portal protein